MKASKLTKRGLAFGAIALLGAFSGCVAYEDGPRSAGGYAPPPSVYVEAGMQGDYVYYPRYQVYYSYSRHNFIYLQGRSWVVRPVPPRVSVNVLYASPSVRLGFRDAPSHHHSQVVQQYPQHWTPPGRETERRDADRGNRDNERGSDRGDHQ